MGQNMPAVGRLGKTGHHAQHLFKIVIDIDNIAKMYYYYIK